MRIGFSAPRGGRAEITQPGATVLPPFVRGVLVRVHCFDNARMRRTRKQSAPSLCLGDLSESLYRLERQRVRDRRVGTFLVVCAALVVACFLAAVWLLPSLR